MIRILLLNAIVFLASATPLEQGRDDGITRLTGTTMGSVQWNVKFSESDLADAGQLEADIAGILSGLNAAMSTWIAESEVSRFNNSDSTDWFPVSEGTAEVVELAQRVSRSSGGAFDITVKPLVELWNFGAGRGEFVIPDRGEIDRVLRSTGYLNLEVRTSPPALRKKVPALQIDLSGIAKGYAVDLVAQRLREAGLQGWFVDIGGEVSVWGTRPDGKPWRVGIEKPLDNARDVEAVVVLRNQCMATSGDYRNFAIVDGKRYSHTISPATGWPAESEIASVSVVAGDCGTADAVATALLAAGEEQFEAISQRLDVESYAILRNGDGSFRHLQTPGFAALMAAAAGERKDADSNFFSTMLATLIIVGLAIAGLSIGAIFANKPLKGSCGGIGSGNSGGDCSTCGNRQEECPQETT